MESDKRNIGRDPHIAPGVYYIEKELCARIDGDRIIVEKEESEDERIRQQIEQALIEHDWSVTYLVSKEDCLAWLERQKGPQLTEEVKEWKKDLERRLKERYGQNSKVATATLDSEKQKEQKPELVQHPPITYTYPSDASRDEQLRMALLALLNSDLIKVAGNKFTKQDFIDWVERQQEQKPVEYLDKDKVYAIMIKLTNLSYSQLIPINSDEFKKLHEITNDVRDLLDYPIEQKPAEWSEEDEDIRQSIIKDIKWERDNTPVTVCKDIRKYDEQINFLKSLRPDSYKNCNSRWKPSEEQIEAFENCLESIPNKYFDDMCELYADIKKLMEDRK